MLISVELSDQLGHSLDDELDEQDELEELDEQLEELELDEQLEDEELELDESHHLLDEEDLQSCGIFLWIPEKNFSFSFC